MCARVCARCERPFNALYCCGLQWASFPLLHTNFYMDNWIWKGKYNLYENPRSCKKQSSMLSPRKRGIMFVPALVCLSVCLFVCYQDHGLRGSASPVLTATGFVNGRWQFSTPHRINTPWPITKKIGTGDYVVGPYGCAKFGANPSIGGFWANRWNITNFFLFIPFFHELTYRWDPSTDFHAWWLKRRGIAQGCAFWGFVDIAPHFRGEIPRKPQFLGRE